MSREAIALTNPIDRLRAIKADDRRGAVRRQSERRAPEAAQDDNGFPLVVASPPTLEQQREHGPSVFSAQLIGQDGQKRGLRGGAPVLDAARSAYLEAEWSGPADRRPKRGTVTKTEI
jgi:hypothetical protein